MNTQFLNSQIHKEMNKKETKCATLNHLRLKLLTLKTLIAHLSNNSLKNLMLI